MHKYLHLYVIIFFSVCLKEQLNPLAVPEKEEKVLAELKIKRKHEDIRWHPYTEVPLVFDGRIFYSKLCKIGKIGDRTLATTSWAYATRAAFSDRVCIGTGVDFHGLLSIKQLRKCCQECPPDADIDMGMLYSVIRAWGYYRDFGGIGEKNFEAYHDRCPTKERREDTRFRWMVKNVYYLEGEEYIKRDIYKYGPATIVFRKYDDFKNIKSGEIYHNYEREDENFKLFAAKIVGWETKLTSDGTTDDTSYWLCLNNSYGSNWGNIGAFKLPMKASEKYVPGVIIAGQKEDKKCIFSRWYDRYILGYHDAFELFGYRTEGEERLIMSLRKQN